jgi:hypothetical protein
MMLLMRIRKSARPAPALVAVGVAAISLSGCVLSVYSSDERDLGKRVDVLESKSGRRR